jgi:nucleoid-associated protein YgaU
VKKLDLKKTLKTLKLNESTISTILGVIVIIFAGVLVFNYLKKGKQGSTVPATNTQIEEKEENQNNKKTYTVKKGQSLWMIAEEIYGSGYNWVDIAKENNIKNPNLIKEGQELKIPAVKAKIAKTTDEAKEKITGGTYTVVKGDNLWEIAVRAYGDGYKWVEIARENKLANPNLIHTGNVLRLPR